MNRLMQTVSVLSFAAALAAAPVVATAQQQTTEPKADTQAEQAVDATAQEAKEAAGEAKEAAGDAKQAAGEAAEDTAAAADKATEEAADAADKAGEAADEAAQEADQAAEQTTEQAGQAVEQTTEEAGQTAEQTTGSAVETTEATGEAVQGDVVAEKPVEPVEGVVTLQDADSILASDLIGATIYNAEDEEVGEIDDAIVLLDGTVKGVVIGVGGFLGLGEKNVAIEMGQISVQTDEDGDPRLVIDTTRESLEAAPEFMTAEEQRAEAAATTAPAPVAGTGTGTNSGMAPAGTTPPAEGTGTTGGTTAPTQ